MEDTSISRTLNFTLISLLNFGVALSATVFPILILPLETSLNISHGLAGFLYTLMFIASAVGTFVESFAADYYGREIFVLFPGFIVATSLVCLALSPTYWLISIFVFFTGLGAGLFSPAGYAAASELFPQQRGRFVGIYDSIFPLSAFGAYGIFRISSYLGSWRFAIGLIGVGLLITSTIFYIAYNPPKRPSYSVKQKPLSPSYQIKFAFEKAKNNPVFLKMVILVIPVTLFAKGIEGFIPTYLVQVRGLTEGFANILYMVYMGLIIPGKILSGVGIDKRGFRWTFIFDIGFVLLGLILFSQVSGFGILVLGIFLLGPARGGVYTTMMTNLLDSVPGESVDLLYGLFMVSVSVFGSIGPVLVGTLADNIGFRWSFVALWFIVLSTLPIMMYMYRSYSGTTSE